MNTEEALKNLIENDIEQAVIATLIYDDSLIPEVRFILNPADFYLLKHQALYEIILDMNTRREGVDLLTLKDELIRRDVLEDVGGEKYIEQILNTRIALTHYRTYAGSLAKLAHRRRIIGFAGKTATLAIDGTKQTPEAMAEIHKEYRTLTASMGRPSVVDAETLMDSIWRTAEEATNNPSHMRGLSTGIHGLDEILMGVRPGLYAVGGASSMGKSTFAGGLIRALSREANGVVMPTEVAAEKALTKIITDLAGIEYKRFLSGMSNAETSRFTEAFATMARCQHNITFIDTEAPNMAEIEAEIQQSKARWLVVDSGTAMSYQLMYEMSKRSKRQVDLRRATTELCQRLQNIARSGVIVIALWQTGRNAKERADKRPGINDFKESGAVEETCDVALGLYRHDYYVARGLAKEDEKYPAGTAKIFVLKDRDGGTGEGEVTVGFRPGMGFTTTIDSSREVPEGY